MKRAIAAVAGLTLGILVALGILAVHGRSASAPAVSAVGPRVARDTGPGEYLILVVGGVYPTRAEAEAANAQLPLGDLQGYYVAPTAQFQGLREQLARPGRWVLVSAFRTAQGAQEFATFARQMFGLPAMILPGRVRSLGGVYAGLGQEADPNGSGPLLHAIPASLRR